MTCDQVRAAVAYFGPAGSFTNAATTRHFGSAASAVAQPSIHAVFAQVETGHCRYGVVPVENSSAGSVVQTLDALIGSSLRIGCEIELRIHLHLLGNPCSHASRLTKVCAHPHALAQASRWLDTHWPALEREPVSSNSEAARLAVEHEHIAALAGDLAVEHYGLLAFAHNVEDRPDNATRFLVIGRDDCAVASGRDKTTIVVPLDVAGALHEVLACFHRHVVTVTRVDARPSRAAIWSYAFLIDVLGHRSEPSVAASLRELEARSIKVKLLGSYPRIKHR